MSRSVWLFCRIFEQLCCVIISNYSVKLTCGLLRTYGSSANRNTDTCEYLLQGYYLCIFHVSVLFWPSPFSVTTPLLPILQVPNTILSKNSFVQLQDFTYKSLHVSSPLCISACTNILKQFAITIKSIEQ